MWLFHRREKSTNHINIGSGQNSTDDVILTTMLRISTDIGSIKAEIKTLYKRLDKIEKKLGV